MPETPLSRKKKLPAQSVKHGLIHYWYSYRSMVFSINIGHIRNIGPEMDQYYRVNIISEPQNPIRYCRYMVVSRYFKPCCKV